MNKVQRQTLKDLAQLLVDHEPQVNYPLHDVRGPLDAASFALTTSQMKAALASGKHLMMDCSQGITSLYKWACLEDPSGPHYNFKFAGYTGSLLAYLPHYSDPKKARTGAIVIYGAGTGEHASLVFEPGKDPLLWSHGFDGGPQLIRLSVQRTYHHLPVTFLNVSGIGPAT